jgi:hypothetical protein
MPSFTLLTTQPTNIKKSKLMEALHAVENLILYAFNHPNNMIMELWNDRARKGEEVCKMFRFQNKPTDQVQNFCFIIVMKASELILIL